MNILYIAVLTCFVKALHQQPAVPAEISNQLPKGYEILDATSGDLNKDALPDWVIILKKPNEDKTSDVVDHPEKRPLLLFTGTANHHFKLMARNNNAVYCVNCGGMMGDPFQAVTIKNGYFSVEHYGGSGWRWTRIITFKYNPADKQWYLYKDGGESFHASDPDNSKTKVLTQKNFGKVAFERFDIYKEH